jgi:hypothetical protein
MNSELQRRQDVKYDSTSNISNSNGDIFRICHCEADIDNPLLSPCYCSGSLKYVHQSCLRQWLAASDTRSCELCKFSFILQTKIKPLSEVSIGAVWAWRNACLVVANPGNEQRRTEASSLRDPVSFRRGCVCHLVTVCAYR